MLQHIQLGYVLKHISPGRPIKGNAVNDFNRLIDDIEQEAIAEGPEAVAELRALETRFRLAAELLAARTSAHMT